MRDNPHENAPSTDRSAFKEAVETLNLGVEGA
jgi:hypothetical protein